MDVDAARLVASIPAEALTRERARHTLHEIAWRAVPETEPSVPDRAACPGFGRRSRLRRLPNSAAREVRMFVHAVYFWLKSGLTPEETDQFVRGLEALAGIESVERTYIGQPADTDREVIDRSYSYALVVVFADQEAHDAYQSHPTHDRFRETCSPFWEKVRIYDSVGSDGR